jgi:glycosyltransferase involved in cell wall biosynthesis
MRSTPFVSIIVPTHNNHCFAKRCIAALVSSTYQNSEIIVVDDGSTDQDAFAIFPPGVQVARLSLRSGPAAARNQGARQARGDVLLFIDADVLVRPETVSQIAARFEHDEELASVFGSYDDVGGEKNFVSQYKNLRHHFTHQQGRPDATTFWAGCGAITREAFTAAGGFDERRYKEPCVEDIELGYRLTAAGRKISLDKKIQVEHLKRWEFRTLLYADVFRRAIPWTKLLLQTGRTRSDLNLQMRERICAALTGLFVATALFGLLTPWIFGVAAGLFISYLAVNREWYLFLFKKRGLRFTLAALPMDLLYFSYSGAIFAFYWSRHLLAGKRSVLLRREAETYK